MPAHRMRHPRRATPYRDDRWVTFCECGWHSGMMDSFSEAEQAGSKHLEDPSPELEA